MIIKGDLILRECKNLKSLGNIEEVHGELICNDELNSLGKLKYVNKISVFNLSVILNSLLEKVNVISCRNFLNITAKELNSKFSDLIIQDLSRRLRIHSDIVIKINNSELQIQNNRNHSNTRFNTKTFTVFYKNELTLVEQKINTIKELQNIIKYISKGKL